MKPAHRGDDAGRKQTDRQKLSRQKCSHADMFEEELPTHVPTYVPTRFYLVPTIVPHLILIGKEIK